MRSARLLTALLALLLPAATLVVAAGPAAAHNVLRSTNPADGATVPTTPTELVLTFDQPAIKVGTSIRITGPDGSVVSTGDPVLVDETVRQPLAPGSPAGAYAVVWRVTSADGHPIEGEFSFTSSGPSKGPSPTSTPAGGSAATPDDVAGSPATTLAGEEAEPASSGSGGLLWLGLLALVLVAAGVVVLARRRGGRTDP